MDEKYYFSFVRRNASLVEELDEMLTTYTDIMKTCKQKGFKTFFVIRPYCARHNEKPCDEDEFHVIPPGNLGTLLPASMVFTPPSVLPSVASGDSPCPPSP